jgi:hypothetical protein
MNWIESGRKWHLTYRFNVPEFAYKEMRKTRIIFVGIASLLVEVVTVRTSVCSAVGRSTASVVTSDSIRNANMPYNFAP